MKLFKKYIICITILTGVIWFYKKSKRIGFITKIQNNDNAFPFPMYPPEINKTIHELLKKDNLIGIYSDGTKIVPQYKNKGES